MHFLEVFVHASALVKAILLLLAFLSIGSWATILYKSLQLYGASREAEHMQAAFQEWESSGKMPALFREAETPVGLLTGVISAAAAVPRHSREQTERVLRVGQGQASEQLESYLIFLATTGATAPFIGLLGTVWGILEAFRGIGAAGSASLAVVAPAIAEALITTAVGLAAAIPAVMAYNFFVHWVQRLNLALESAGEELQHLTSRAV